MIIGYARVSTDLQTTALQRDALARSGVEQVFEDSASGATRLRPELARALAALQEGDTLIVWRLDRLGRSLRDLIAITGEIAAKKAHFRSLTEALDTSTAAGRMLFHVLGAFAQFERDLMVERTKAGQAAAKLRGRAPGRRRALSPSQVAIARKLAASGEPATEVARALGCSRATIYRALDLSR